MSLRLRTLGGLSLDADDGSPIAGRITQRRRLALLVLIAAARNGGITRDRVLGLLWPERDEEHARHALSQALYAIRQALGADAVLAGVDELRLNPALITSDIAELNDALARGDHARVAALSTGVFLEGFFLSDAEEFERWVDGERDRLRAAHAEALEALASSADPAAAVAWLRKRVGLEPLNSGATLRLMRALAAGGDRAGALLTYRTHVTLLREELGITEPAELRAYAEELGTPKDAGVFGRERASLGELGVERVSAAATPTTPTQPVRPHTPAHARARPLIAAGAVIMVLAAIALRAQTSRIEPRVLVLGSVTGPDSTLALAVREALRAELEQQEGVRVLPDAAVSRTLELMERAPGEALEPALAMEVAERRGVPFVVTGTVQPLGSGAQLIARLMDAQTDQVLATATERPATEDEVIDAVTRIARAMRERVAGRRAIPAAKPLPAVTTRSLPALRSYALAREAWNKGEAARALELAEAALVHDSLFALAHYLTADMLWFIDSQRHSDEHMTRALELADRLPARERLIVRARHEQLVRDRPDSALVYWKLLVASYPDESLGYEGMRWVYRGAGDYKNMAAASQLAYARDSAAAFAVAAADRAMERAAANDTVGALAAVRNAPTHYQTNPDYVRYQWALRYGKPGHLLNYGGLHPLSQQYAFLLNSRLDSAAELLHQLTGRGPQAHLRALLVQGLIELEENRPDSARNRLRAGVERIADADLSPAAFARLTERLAHLAALLQDNEALARLRALIEQWDRGRQLRSYALVRQTLAAAEAYARGDMQRSAELAAQSAASGVLFYGRSTGTIKLLEADARAAAGDRAAARAVYAALASPKELEDGDWEVRGVIRIIARGRLGL